MGHILKAKVSEKGFRKLGLIAKLVERSVKRSLKEGVETYMLPEAAAKAPSYEEEKRILIEGVGNIGYHYVELGADTFVESGRVGLREAIWDDYVEVSSDGDLISARTGHTQEINEKTKMQYYRKSSGGGLHTTYPFGGRFVEAIEFGGVWEVTPRSSKWLLRPEPDLKVPSMTKVAFPYRMYRQALYSNGVRRKIRTLIKTNIRKILK